MRVLMNFNLTDVTVLGDDVEFGSDVFTPNENYITLYCHHYSSAFYYAVSNNISYSFI